MRVWLIVLPEDPYRTILHPDTNNPLWESRTDPATGEVVETYAINTCEPNALMAELHDR